MYSATPWPRGFRGAWHSGLKASKKETEGLELRFIKSYDTALWVLSVFLGAGPGSRAWFGLPKSFEDLGGATLL